MNGSKQIFAFIYHFGLSLKSTFAKLQITLLLIEIENRPTARWKPKPGDLSSVQSGRIEVNPYFIHKAFGVNLFLHQNLRYLQIFNKKEDYISNLNYSEFEVNGIDQ